VCWCACASLPIYSHACALSRSLSRALARSLLLSRSRFLPPFLSRALPFPLSHIFYRGRVLSLFVVHDLFFPVLRLLSLPTLNDTTAAALPFRSDRACSPLIITVVPGCKYCIAIGDTSTLLMKIHKLKVFNLKVFIKE